MQDTQKVSERPASARDEEYSLKIIGLHFVSSVSVSTNTNLLYTYRSKRNYKQSGRSEFVQVLKSGLLKSKLAFCCDLGSMCP